MIALVVGLALVLVVATLMPRLQDAPVQDPDGSTQLASSANAQTRDDAAATAASLQPIEANGLQTVSIAPMQEGDAAEDADWPELPPLLAAVIEMDGFDPDWSEMPIAPNLQRWRQEASDSPERARELAGSLRRCVGQTDDSIRAVLGDWRQEQARIQARNDGEARTRQQLDYWAQRYRFRIEALRHCADVEEPVSEYLRWLERAARELPDSESRQRLRLEFVENAFKDMRSAGARIGRINEVIRRRDLARAWLEQLVESGHLRAINLYSAEQLGQADLYGPDLFAACRWYYVGELRQAVAWPSRPGASTAAELWRDGPSRIACEELSPELQTQAVQLGRQDYLRLFGQQPDA